MCKLHRILFEVNKLSILPLSIAQAKQLSKTHIYKISFYQWNSVKQVSKAQQLGFKTSQGALKSKISPAKTSHFIATMTCNLININSQMILQFHRTPFIHCESLK